MKVTLRQIPRVLLVLVLFLAVDVIVPVAHAQENRSASGKELYDQIKSFSLGSPVAVNALALRRDRAEMIFTGTFYFATPVDGHVTGAVFVGDGRFRAQIPPNDFEKENVKRLLGADTVESDFKTAVLRFSDDTFEQLGQKTGASAGPVDPGIQKTATGVDARILKETGANLSARIALSILNQEHPGFFFANFDGGKRGRFSFLLDYQNRLPVANFHINGGEKGLIFQYLPELYDNEIWLGFYGEADYQRGSVNYSDANDLLDVNHYDMDIDLREHKKYLRLRSHLKCDTKFANLRAVTFSIGEDLSEYDSQRLKKQLRLQQAELDGKGISFAQEDWEGGFTVFLPDVVKVNQGLDFAFTFEGNFMQDAQGFVDRYYPRYDSPAFIDSYYPRSTTSWFPRNGYLDRATFDLTFRHPKKLRIASVGERLSEEPDLEDKDALITKYRMPQPVALVTFALGPFERHQQTIRADKGGGSGDPITIEFNSLPGSLKAIKEDFILAELDNSLRYFTVMFGKYPYPVFGATYHPFFFGQGFPSMLMIPDADRASKFTYSFIAHETAHQWWGNIVAWRSYRDQWLSEGFAEYSGILYTDLRAGPDASRDLINRARASLKEPPETERGLGKGKLADVGPLILGHRLNTSKTFGAYQTLIYAKGALVLRMLHFLFTDPATGKGDAFFAMMTDFVNRHRNGFASTDDFREVANEHFVQTPIARQYKMTSLDWFFNQWVYQAALPSYQLEYHFQDQPDGKILMSGTVTQDNAPNEWFMLLPVAMTFPGKQTVYTTVAADGPRATFAIKLPMKPSKVELDPQRWVLSENTSTK